jgi:hypothetical protein
MSIQATSLVFISHPAMQSDSRLEGHRAGRARLRQPVDGRWVILAEGEPFWPLRPAVVTMGRPKRQRPGSLPAFTLFGLAAVPSPPRNFELQPRRSGLNRFGAILDPRAALFERAHDRSLVAARGRTIAKACRLACSELRLRRFPCGPCNCGVCVALLFFARNMAHRLSHLKIGFRRFQSVSGFRTSVSTVRTGTPTFC